MRGCYHIGVAASASKIRQKQVRATFIAIATQQRGSCMGTGMTRTLAVDVLLGLTSVDGFGPSADNHSLTLRW
jgi:hypothetical protein